MAIHPEHPIFKSGEVLVLDGGISNELSKHIDFDIHKDPLWTAKALLNSPEAIVQTHLAYLNAGADIISTVTYQASTAGFSKYLNMSMEEGEAVIIKAVALAKEAVDEFMKSGTDPRRNNGAPRPLIAGSVGPYGAYLCDRSEYSGKYMDVINEGDLITFHSQRLRCLIEAGVDLLILETMPSVKEVEVLLKSLQDLPPIKTLVSFSIMASPGNDAKLRTAYGDEIKSILELLMKYPAVIGFGCNCCSPEIVQMFLEQSSSEAETLPNFDLGHYKRTVYPNKGNWYSDMGWVEKDNTRSATVDTYVNDWVLAGAEIIGGCCEVGPPIIAKIRATVDLGKHSTSSS